MTAAAQEILNIFTAPPRKLNELVSDRTRTLLTNCLRTVADINPTPCLYAFMINKNPKLSAAMVRHEVRHAKDYLATPELRQAAKVFYESLHTVLHKLANAQEIPSSLVIAMTTAYDTFVNLFKLKNGWASPYHFPELEKIEIAPSDNGPGWDPVYQAYLSYRECRPRFF